MIWDGKKWVTNPNPNVQNIQYSASFYEETHDGVHDWPPSGADRGRDIGGVFVAEKRDCQMSTKEVNLYWATSTANYTRYTGPVPAGGYSIGSLGNSSTESQLNAAGATAISRAIPTAPAANVSVMLAELFREGVPAAVGSTLLKNRFRDYRDIGGEYLNYQFGWKPIVSDLKSVSKAIMDSQEILDQLERDSGRYVRRKFAFPSVTQSSTSSGGSVGHPVQSYTPSGMIWNADSWRRDTTFSQRRWFSGAFTYHFEQPTSVGGRMRSAAQKARILYGLDLTPEVVWNLTPWSWMADWVANAGDVMSNVSRFSRDGLAMKYGYIMEQSDWSSTYALTNVLCSPFWGASAAQRIRVDPVTTSTKSYKIRQPASPYGFGLTGEDFDPRQWAILGALGISRGPTTL
jgi:hypothetical protein